MRVAEGGAEIISASQVAELFMLSACLSSCFDCSWQSLFPGEIPQGDRILLEVSLVSVNILAFNYLNSILHLLIFYFVLEVVLGN